jgi:hypothetical protein
MDQERDADRTRPPQEPRPADADLLPTLEPDPEFAASYVGWRLERREPRR